MLTRVATGFILFLTLCGCGTSVRTRLQYPNKFNFINVSEPFELIVIEFHKNSAFCATEALPYALLIGTTSNDKLPPEISVLSYCDNRTFQLNDKLTIEPTDNPIGRTSLNPVYLVKDTTINGIKTKWLIGSEYPAVWGNPTVN